MANNKYNLKSSTKKSWLNRNLLLSLSLYLTTYTAFGWLIASRIVLWAELLLKQNIPIEMFLEEDFLLPFLQLFALLVIIIITFFFSTPVALTTFLFQDSINSDVKGFISILLWSIILVFAFCYFDYLADLLVLIAVNILLRLDLRKRKYNNWQIIFTILFCAAIAFSAGMMLFEFFSHH